jgi:hypothetical protein
MSTSELEPEIDNYKKQNNVNKLILQNQIQIGLHLQKEIGNKQVMIRTELRHRMALNMIKGVLQGQSRYIQKRYFSKWLDQV